MGRKSLEEIRKKEIINGLYKVAKKEGLENASLAKVAKILDINPSLILHYFKSRDELIDNLVDYNLERYKSLYKVTEESKGDPESLRLLIDNLFSRKWNRLFDDGIFYSCYAQIYRKKQFKRKFRTLHDALREMLREALQVAHDQGSIQVDPEEATDLIFILVEGAYYYLGMIEDDAIYKAKENLYKQQALIILGLEVNSEIA
jgi:AcrR family transcriptional regulator